jgi:predicted transposase YbfD/YdcC
MDGFEVFWEGLEDPRTGNASLHDFHELLMIALVGRARSIWRCSPRRTSLFCACFSSWKTAFPSHDTFSRLFRQLDPDQFRAAFQRFMAVFSKQCQGVVAIDGKVLRRSFDRASGKSPLHMVSAWGCEQRLVLAQIATDAKSNGIIAVPELLKMLSMKGAIVTTGTLNSQRAIAQQIVDQGGDYALALKGDQGTLHADVASILTIRQAMSPRPIQTSTRIMAVSSETRAATVSTDIAWLQEKHRWAGLAAIGKVVRIRETPAKTTTETAYYLLSTACSPECFNEVVRSHWDVENKLHWRQDAVMNEDQDRTRSLRGKFKRTGSDDEYRSSLINAIAL